MLAHARSIVFTRPSMGARTDAAHAMCWAQPTTANQKRLLAHGQRGEWRRDVRGR